MLKAIVKMLSRMPLGVHYAISDYVLYPALYHIVRYRRSMVTKNLIASFPDKSSQEIATIARKFYHHICDVIVEAVYAYTASDEEMRQRVTFSETKTGEEEVLRKGGGIVMLSHTGNWEWMLDIAKQFYYPQIQLCAAYRKMNSKPFDNLVKDMRLQRGTLLMEKQRVLREFVRLRHAENPVIFALLSDQKPSPKNAHYWTTFLHQDTGFLTGSEVLARKFDLPVFYVSVTSPRRGYYHVEYLPICIEPLETDEMYITRRYVELLEENIRQQPEMWLWTHNRWKFKREG